MNTKKKTKYQNKPHSNTMRNVNNNDIKTEKRNKILAYILAAFMVLWTIGSVLGSIGFVKSSAAEIEVVPSNSITGDGWIIELDGISGARLYDQGRLAGAVVGVYTIEFQRQVDYIVLKHNSGTEIYTTQWTIGYNYVKKPFTISTSFGDEVMAETIDVNINGNIDFIYGAIPLKAVYFSRDNGRVFGFDIDFVDGNGAYVGTLPIRQFSDFEYNTATEFQCSFDNRNVFYVSNNDFFTQELRFLPYDASDNYLQGYEEGYAVGNADGFGVGYNEGAQDAGDYTFMSLISSVVDVPIQAFMGLFNFELLGVNLSGFFLSLLTVCVIVAVIKLFV